MPIPDDARLDAIAESVAELLRRQNEFDKRLGLLEATVFKKQESVSRETEAAPRSIPEAFPATSVAPPVQVEEAIPPTEPAVPMFFPTAVRASRLSSPSKPVLEMKVGLTILNRVGVVTLVLGVAFFFKWAIDNNWVGPAGRVILGLLAGFAALGAADYFWRKAQAVFAQGVTGAGAAVLYLSCYAAYGFYHLIAQSFAFLLMFSVTVLACALSLRYASQAIAGLGFFGAYLTPLLLSRGEDHPWFLCSYLLLVNVAVFALSRRRTWRVLEILSFVSTILIYGGWLLRHGSDGNERLVAALALLAYYALFLQSSVRALSYVTQFLAANAAVVIAQRSAGLFFGLGLLLSSGGLALAELRRMPRLLGIAFASFWFSYWVWRLGGTANVGLTSQWFGVTFSFLLFLTWQGSRLVSREREVTVQRLSLLAVNSAVYYGAAYRLLDRSHHNLLGPLAVAVAGIHLLLGAYLYRSRSSNPDMRPALLSLGISVCFLALAIPIQFTGFTVAMSWALLAAALTWIGSHLESEKTISGALFLFALAILRLMIFDSVRYAGNEQPHMLLANLRLLTFVVSAVSLWAAARWSAPLFRQLGLVEYFTGHVVLLWGLTLEVLDWAGKYTAAQNALSVETVAVSVLFAVYAAVLVSIGVATRTATNRIAGLLLMGFVVLKLYLFDIWQLERVYKISAFVILGILLIATSFLYSRFRQFIESWWKDEEAKSEQTTS